MKAFSDQDFRRPAADGLFLVQERHPITIRVYPTVLLKLTDIARLQQHHHHQPEDMTETQHPFRDGGQLVRKRIHGCLSPIFYLSMSRW